MTKRQDTPAPRRSHVHPLSSHDAAERFLRINKKVEGQLYEDETLLDERCTKWGCDSRLVGVLTPKGRYVSCPECHWLTGNRPRVCGVRLLYVGYVLATPFVLAFLAFAWSVLGEPDNNTLRYIIMRILRRH